jgi:iron complex transport system substrate-binding protein
VVAVSVETGDLALELIGAERVVAVNDSARESESGNQSELAGQVEGTVTGAPSPDPEQILSFEPDLVLLTGRHDDEKSVADSLATSGVPTATFSSGNFMSPDAVIASLTVLGELLGAEQEASTIAAGIEEKVSAVEEQVSDAEESPRALVLFARGGKQMIEQANATTTELIELAGGTSIARDEKWNASPSADPEVIISAAPDVILVQDFHGAGLGPFQELLGSDALSEVPAVAQDRIELVDAMTTSGTAGSRIGEGLEQVAGILHPDLADPES